jgi:hypothetical protein
MVFTRSIRGRAGLNIRYNNDDIPSAAAMGIPRKSKITKTTNNMDTGTKPS